MDRISRALELARQNRPSVVEVPSRLEQSEIEYSRTRRVDVSLDVLERNRIISPGSREACADSFRLLRTRVLRRMEQKNWKTLGITSASPGEGKTLTAINLAVTISMEPNYTALLVDADLRRPSIHHRFEFEPSLGLSDYLTSGAPLEDLLVNPGIRDLVILPGRRGYEASSELLASPKMTALVEDIRAHYASRIVLFDLPPLLVADDVVALSRHLDAVLLVVQDGQTQSGDLVRALELLENVEILGSVLNRSLETGRGYDYY
jgi:capsular exopolysaccharide synthesis family protein